LFLAKIKDVYLRHMYFCLQKSLLDPNWILSLLGVPISSSSSSGDSSSSSSNGNSILIVIKIVCNITWVNITFVIVIISNGAVDVGRKPEVIDA